MTRWNLRSGILVLIIGLAAALPPAHAQQPPDLVQSDASGNTASGTAALYSVTPSTTGSGSDNSAFGYGALYLDSTGSYNTAVGHLALAANSSGTFNTAVGSGSLFSNTTGVYNTAIGTGALYSNVVGNNNTAVGSDALYANLGNQNTANGFKALYSNTTGANDTAFGAYALYSNTTGQGNEAQGVNALYNNITGIRNLGIGSNALFGNTSGGYNVGLGFNAGYNQTSGSYNIYIANPGIAGESQTLRLGANPDPQVPGSGILSAYVAGVATSQVTGGSAVYVTSSGQLGVLASSERFKTNIETMGDASEKLAQLRPVTFRLKADPQGTKQYGLIAEEVAKVYPELVIHGTDGQIDGVRYEELAPMLLNVFQQQQAQLAAQAGKTDSQAEIIRNLQMRAGKFDAQARGIRNLEAQVAQLNEFRQSMLAALGAARPQEQLVARAP